MAITMREGVVYEIQVDDRGTPTLTKFRAAMDAVDKSTRRASTATQTLTADMTKAAGAADAQIAATGERARSYAEQQQRVIELQKRWSMQAVGTRLALQSIEATVGMIGEGIAGSLVDGFYDWEAAAKGVLKQLISMTIQMLAMKAVMSAMGGAGMGMGGSVVSLSLFSVGHTGGLVKDLPKYHSGGMVGGTNRERPIMALESEYVMSPGATRSIGVRNLDHMNKTGQAPITFAPNITVNGVSRGDGSAVGREIANAMWNEFDRRYRRGMKLGA